MSASKEIRHMEQMKFKVGDRVKVISDPDGLEILGSRGSITRVMDDDLLYDVYLDFGCHLFCPESWLERVRDAQTKANMIPSGIDLTLDDRLELLEYYKLWVGKASKLDPSHGAKPVDVKDALRKYSGKGKHSLFSLLETETRFTPDEADAEIRKLILGDTK